MSLKGTAMTDKVLRGKIKDIRQIEDVNALYAEAEELIDRAADILAQVQEIQGAVGRISHIYLLATGWQGNASPYSQVVAIDGVTANSKIDINPSIEQLAKFHEKDIAFVAENENGKVTVYCIGQKPTTNYDMQITITGVITNG